ncbi:MAG: hypothetical protein WAO74_01545 [Polaribacter sp.]|uniref:hypothetical protein n=1 Tax=Polaribacter sp. TaxID=1920175 RepID=UPI003BAFB209
MNRIPIDISKSLKAEKIVTRELFIEKLINYLFPLVHILIFPSIAIMGMISNLIKNESIKLYLFLSVISLIISGFLIYSVFSVYKFQRIKGLSRGKNSNFIKKIAKRNKWNISENNQHISIINFSWRETGTDWGKQITILYDKNEILVNCISFVLYSSPSPFHWFANKRKINKLIKEFEFEIKNVLQQRV